MSLAFCSLKPGQSPPTSIYLICCRSLLPPFINDHSVMAAAGSTSAAQLALPTIPTVCIAPTDPSQAGLLLSPASEVIPKKLVDKIRSSRFIEMKELLQHLSPCPTGGATGANLHPGSRNRSSSSSRSILFTHLVLLFSWFCGNLNVRPDHQGPACICTSRYQTNPESRRTHMDGLR